ncbi:hypothetical protein ABZ345_12695 [Lentzea sp. NPDC005914]|uniref:hypothetical protein n=1 Tax=Lentzea sp. NPDC005914 TaxID=3154572 RepID=UPI0033F93DDC
MDELTAQLEQVFGVAQSRETGLLIDTFDGAGVDTGKEVVAVSVTNTRVVPWSQTRAVAWTNTRVVAWSNTRVVAWCGNTRVAVPA